MRVFESEVLGAGSETSVGDPASGFARLAPVKIAIGRSGEGIH